MQHVFGMYKIMQEVREVHIPEKAEAWQEQYYKNIVQLKLGIHMGNHLTVPWLGLSLSLPWSGFNPCLGN